MPLSIDDPDEYARVKAEQDRLFNLPTDDPEVLAWLEKHQTDHQARKRELFGSEYRNSHEWIKARFPWWDGSRLCESRLLGIVRTRTGIPIADLERMPMPELMGLIAAAGEVQQQPVRSSESEVIPKECQTEPMTKQEAAKRYRPDMTNKDSRRKALRKAIESGELRCIEITRQSFIFDERQLRTSQDKSQDN